VTTQRNRTHRNWRYQGLALALLCYFLGQALSNATATSLTIDEGLHITSGYTIWRTGDYRLIEEHPPLVKLWLALPLLPVPDLADPTTLPAWQDAASPTTESLPLLQMTQQLLYPYEPVDSWLFPGRAMSALLGIILLAVIARWTRDWVNPAAALVALGLAAFDPNLLAHAAVAGTDLGAATLITLALWRATRFLKNPDLPSAAITGVLLGLALSAKLTASLLGPSLALAGILVLLTVTPAKRIRLVKLGLATITVAGVTLWATYGFQIGRVPGIPVPLPATSHAIPILRLMDHSGGGHQAYLLGENSNYGWTTYFPVAFLIKTPIAALLAMAGGLVASAVVVWRTKTGPARLAALLSAPVLFAATYVITSLLSSLNIGYRHLLPLLPILYVATGAIVRVCRLSSTVVRVGIRIATGALLLSQATATLAQSPHLLAYFNAAVGGSGNGWRYLADSNTDWGQAYKALADYQSDNAIGPVQLSAFIFYDPALYDVDYTALTPLGGDTPAVFPSRFAPPAGDYAISATPLDGIPLADGEMYDWFRWRVPDVQLGDALFIYHVTTEETATHWLAQCISPTAALSAEAITAGFGGEPERQLSFDCTRTWVYPSAASGPGAYVLHGALLDDPLSARLHRSAPPATNPFVKARLATTVIAYRQRAYRTEPAFAIFRQTESPQLDAGAWLDPVAVTLPVHLDGPLAFRGAQHRVAGGEYEVETWWEVTQTPDGRPFSIMGHLLAQNGEPLGVDDGLGIAPADLRAGDILVRTHRFHAKVGSQGLHFQTGAYWLDTIERWPLSDTPDDNVILVMLNARN